MDLVDHGNSEDERRFKNLATKVLSNGVEVLVKDKNDGKQEQVNYCNIIFLTSFFSGEYYTLFRFRTLFIHNYLHNVMSLFIIAFIFSAETKADARNIIQTSISSCTIAI